jgi:uncharacterized protein YebE (UPF0316 family)
MNLTVFFSSGLFTWLILPGLIFFSRICDVTIGTIRIIFVSKGAKFLAPVFGFFEVLIWLVAIGQIMKNLNNVACYFAYAGGFAMGNFIGIALEERLAMGTLVVRIYINDDGVSLIDSLKAAGFGATVISAHGLAGPVNIISSVIKRVALKEVDGIIKKYYPNAFYSVEEVRFVNAGIFPARNYKLYSRTDGHSKNSFIVNEVKTTKA